MYRYNSVGLYSQIPFFYVNNINLRKILEYIYTYCDYRILLWQSVPEEQVNPMSSSVLFQSKLYHLV